MENSTWQGVYNACAPEPITSKALGKAVAVACGKPNALLMPAPEFALRLTPGGMSAMFLSSSRTVPTKPLAAGFQFKFTEASVAIKDLLDKQA
jgi:NAD dependent epimerase/dehydratase family enzyme